MRIKDPFFLGFRESATHRVRGIALGDIVGILFPATEFLTHTMSLGALKNNIDFGCSPYVIAVPTLVDFVVRQMSGLLAGIHTVHFAGILIK